MTNAELNTDALKRYNAAMEAWVEARATRVTSAFEAELHALDAARVREVRIKVIADVALANAMDLSCVGVLDLLTAQARGEIACMMATKPDTGSSPQEPPST